MGGGKIINLVEHYKQAYNYTIKYPYLPCVNGCSAYGKILTLPIEVNIFYICMT